MDEKTRRKISRKMKRCAEILFKHRNIKTIADPSNSLFVGNGGFGCGLTREFLLGIFGPFGELENIVMIRGEPYSFLSYHQKADAISAMHAINGQKLDSGHVLYLAYIANSDMPQLPVSEGAWPSGLVLLKDFISEEEEAQLMAVIHCEDVKEEKALLKHRKVKHYGYEFVYGSNNVDRNKKLEQGIPDACLPHLERLVALGHLHKVPDQLTVNHYSPGQGIPPHVDTHSVFEDGIVSLSLGSQVVMDFYHPEKEEEEGVPLLLPRRSALVMLGESRYLWKHGITPRKTDVAPSEEGGEGSHLTLLHRSTRISLTFRRIRDDECRCEYKNQCDSQQKIKSNMEDFVNNEEAQKLEKKYVNLVYEEIAHHFSNTRYKPWPKVTSFLSSIAPGSFVLDVGCGNGKNMKLTNRCYEVGCDASPQLARVCLDRGMEVLVADCLRLPFRDDCADALICIAVVHHMSTKARRLSAVREIVRLLRPEGRALVYVWAFEQERDEGQSSKYLKRPEEVQSHDGAVSVIEVCDRTLLPVHRNKTDFRTQDVLVPWKKEDASRDVVHHRFYHVFVEGELEELVRESGARIVSSYYDEGNWCITFTK